MSSQVRGFRSSDGTEENDVINLGRHMGRPQKPQYFSETNYN